jgi:hypothetical protein
VCCVVFFKHADSLYIALRMQKYKKNMKDSHAKQEK